METFRGRGRKQRLPGQFIRQKQSTIRRTTQGGAIQMQNQMNQVIHLQKPIKRRGRIILSQDHGSNQLSEFQMGSLNQNQQNKNTLNNSVNDTPKTLMFQQETFLIFYF